jgi:hypothetical protein
MKAMHLKIGISGFLSFLIMSSDGLLVFKKTTATFGVGSKG